MQTQLPTPTTDDALLLAWRTGDRHAGETLVTRHWESISRFFTRKLGPDCEDLIQDTFTACIEGATRYRGESSFRAYLFGVARHKLLRFLRTKMRDEKHFDPGTVSIAETTHSYTSLIAADRSRAKLLLALRKLPIDTQTMLELHYWEGMALKELAELFEVPVGTVKTQMRKGRLKLAKTLGEALDAR